MLARDGLERREIARGKNGTYTALSATPMSPETNALIETYGLPLQLVLAMFGMGATLSVRDFLQVARHPVGLALGLALQLLLVPALALTIVHTVGLSKGWAVGLLLVAVVPGGTVSNLLTFIGRGDAALSVTVTAVTTVVAVFSIPLFLPVLTGGVDVALPTARIVRDILLFLLTPLVVGMLVFRFLTQHAQTISKWSIRGSLALVGLITVGALSSGRIDVLGYGFGPPLVIIAFGTTLALVTPQLCRLLGRYDEDTVALSVEVVARNIGIALLMVRFFFPGEEAQAHILYTCLFYGGASIFFALPILIRHRLGRGAVLLRRPYPRAANATQ